MPQAEHHPWDTKSFHAGVNSQVDNELLGKGEAGEYLAARNMRPNSADNLSALSSVAGEEIMFPGLDNSWNSYYSGNIGRGNWRCVGATTVTVNTIPVSVELWCDVGERLNPFVRVDGKIVCASSQLPIYPDKPIQVAGKNSTESPEISFTNNEDPPVVLMVDDMLINSGYSVNSTTGVETEKYFGNFDIGEHSVQTPSYFHMPMFVEVTTNTTYNGAEIFLPESGDPGLNCGQHCYQVRYASASGDKTALTLPTPLIPVGKQFLADASDAYPAARTFGEEEGYQSNYGIVLKLRIENRLNYEYVEVFRTSYDTGQPIGFTPTTILVGSFAMEQGEMSVKYIVDFGRDEGALTEEDVSTLSRSVRTCKSIRYFNNRKWLFNVEYGTNIIDETVFRNFPSIPILRNIGNNAHADPYNCAYYKNIQSGERYSYAYVFFDSNFSRSFAVPAPGLQDYQMPDRRTAMNPISELYSYDTVPVGVDTDNNVNKKIFERFSFERAKQKEDLTFASIHKDNYYPLTPTGQEDTSYDKLDQRVNTTAYTDETNYHDYNPAAYGHEYYSQGMALWGVDTSKLPSWVTSFTIVRTQAAGRVKFQGLGFYLLFSHHNKETWRVAFYSPDTDSLCGIVDIDTLDWNRLKAEVVAPYGFHSEVYNAGGVEWPWVDMATYAKLIVDNVNINGSGSVKFGKWRNSAGAFPTWVTASDKKFTVTQFAQYSGDNVADRENGYNSEYYTMQFDSELYQNPMTDHKHYSWYGTKMFHEPLYLFNIIDANAAVPQGNITNYYDTGVHVKIKSCIGTYQQGISDYPLVDERWEDCIPMISTDSAQFATLKDRNTFIYIKDSMGVGRRWLNVTYKSDASKNIYKQEIAQNGYVTINNEMVYGLYTHTDTNNHRDFSIVFDVYDKDGVLMHPSEGEEIWVHYDNMMPIEVFGGDTYVNDAIYSPIDRKKGSDSDGGTLRFDVGMPYHKIQMANIGLLDGTGSSETYNSICRIKAIRQLVCMFVCESRVNLWYGYEVPTTPAEEIQLGELPSPWKCFPYTHYIMRPDEWDSDNLNNNYESDGGQISDQYAIDYPHESSWWGFGGFRYRPKQNMDYYHNQRFNIYPTRPEVGYKERVRYFDRVIYSLEQVPGTQNSPSLRTFLPGNYYDLPDEYGEGKYLWDAISSRGSNIYAITENGIAVVLVGKNIMSQVEGVELATMIGTQGQYIGGHVWIENKTGMSGEMWRSAVEAENLLFFANRTGVYGFNGESVEDISRHWYYNRIRPLLSAVDSSKHVAAAFDGKNGEYWLQLETDSDEYVMAYSVANKHWNDRYDYRFDRYISIDNKVYGIGNRGTNVRKGANTYVIEDGELIGGQKMVSEVWNVCAPVKFYPEEPVPWILEKEFIRIRIASNLKPTKVYFYDYYGQDVQAELTADYDYYLKNYGNFEQYVPRRLAIADAERKRMQGRAMIYRVIYEGGGFIVRQIAVQFKTLK